MTKSYWLVVIAMLCLPFYGWTQCFSPPTPPSCTGSEPALMSDETLDEGTTKWYHGPAATFNSLTLDGGTLVVCSDLTIDKFYMESGTIFILPGARFVIGSGIGSGIILRGNSAIYNFGFCDIRRNLSLESGSAGPSAPNIVVNATTSSIFRMSSQYLVINNPDSWFVNNGDAEFWGTIQETQARPGCICLGNGSVMNMAVQINKVANAFTVSSGSACVQVRQYSQFFQPLTAEPGLRACLGPGHFSDSGCIPFGCTPNNWGAATVLNACSSCAAFAVLQVKLYDMQVVRNPAGTHQLSWKMDQGRSEARFRVLRSADGRSYQVLDSLSIPFRLSTQFSTTDPAPLPGDNYYMIQYYDPQNGYTANSKAVRIHADPVSPLQIFPVPFDQQLTVQFTGDNKPEQILLTDITGRNVRIHWYRVPQQNQVRIQVLEPLSTELYLIHIRTKQTVISKTVLRH